MLRFLRKSMKGVLITVAVIFIASMFYGLGYQALTGRQETGDQGVIARVGGKPISSLRLNQDLNVMLAQAPSLYLPQDLLNLQSLALNKSIDFTLILQQAKKKQRVSGAELNATIQSIIKTQNLKDEAGLKDALKRSGLSYDQFKQMLREDILVQKMMQEIQNVSLTPNDLREVQVNHILLMPHEELVTAESNPKKREEKAWALARKKAEEVLAKVKQGGNFESLAKQYSDDPGTKSKGGDLGYFGLGSMVPEFETAAFNLKVGETSGLVKTVYGYHILKLENTRVKKVKAGSNLEQEILNEKRERAFREWFMPLKKKAKIEIVDPLLLANDLRFKGQFKEAIAEFLSASRLEPTNPYPHLMLGDTYELMGEGKLALTEYQRATEVAPGNIYAYISLGQAYLRLADPRGAKESFERASLIAGENKEAHQRLLEVFKKLGLSEQVGREQKVLAQLEAREKMKKELIEKSKSAK